jgi:hypothetical protein
MRGVPDLKEDRMGDHEHLDLSKGWCCDGRTWQEHASEGGDCCQAEGTKLEDLPADGQRQARERLAEAR